MKRLIGYERGINLGGWLSQCTPSIEHYKTFIQEKDIKQIASWGLDHVRVPVDYILVETEEGTPRLEGFEYIDKCIDWCQRYGLNMILDLHKTAGYSFDEQDTAHAFFEEEALQQRFINLWTIFAKRYGKYADRMCFELLNEIVDPNVSEKWNEIAKRAVKAIRSIAPTIKIIIGGVCYNSVKSVKYLDAPYDEHIVYNFHCYEPFIFTHQKACWVEHMPKDLEVHYPTTLKELREKRAGLAEVVVGTIDGKELKEIGPDFFESLFEEVIHVAEERNVAIYCGEYGVIDQAPQLDTLNWYRDIHEVFEKYHIARAAWTYKEMDFGLTDLHYQSIYEDLLKLL